MEVAQRAQADSGELPDNHINRYFEITDPEGVLSQPLNGPIHVFEPSAETSLCGHVDASAFRTSRVANVPEGRSIVYHVAICENCSRSVRKQVREGDLTTGYEALDVALQATPGDEVIVETPGDEYTVTVAESGFNICSIRLRGPTKRDTPSEVKSHHWVNKLTANVDPDGTVTVHPPYSAAEGPEEATGTVRFAERRPCTERFGVRFPARALR